MIPRDSVQEPGTSPETGSRRSFIRVPKANLSVSDRDITGRLAWGEIPVRTLYFFFLFSLTCPSDGHESSVFESVQLFSFYTLHKGGHILYWLVLLFYPRCDLSICTIPIYCPTLLFWFNLWNSQKQLNLIKCKKFGFNFTTLQRNCCI